MATLSLRNLYKRYPDGVTAVTDCCLEIADKEFLVLTGPSGCGKSTILRMIAGLEDISGGQLYIGDALVNHTAPKNRGVAMVFQNDALYPHMTVFDNMAFGLKLRKTPKGEIKRRVNEAANLLDITHLLDRKPKSLSAGQRRRVALARAIVREPEVYLLDEPFSSLDVKLRAQMRAELSMLHLKLGATFVCVAQDQTEAMAMGGKIVVLKDGFIQQVASPAALYHKPCNLFVAGFIGSPQMNFIGANILRDSGAYCAEFGETDRRYTVTLPDGLEKIKSYAGKEVVMGVRPEHLHIEETLLPSATTGVIDATVEISETTGAEAYLRLAGAGCSWTVRAAPGALPKPGDMVHITIDSPHIHLFDKETERAITD